MGELEGTWELAEAEELLGDSLFFSGESGSVVHYRAAQQARAGLAGFCPTAIGGQIIGLAPCGSRLRKSWPRACKAAGQPDAALRVKTTITGP